MKSIFSVQSDVVVTSAVHSVPPFAVCLTRSRGDGSSARAKFGRRNGSS